MELGQIKSYEIRDCLTQIHQSYYDLHNIGFWVINKPYTVNRQRMVTITKQIRTSFYKTF